MEQTTHRRRLELSGSALKIIAMVTMLIDHIGAAVLVRYLLGMQSHIGSIEAYNQLFILYRVLRGIGRISFPIYCFLLVEGFQKTRNLKNTSCGWEFSRLSQKCLLTCAFRPELFAWNTRVLC